MPFEFHLNQPNFNLNSNISLSDSFHYQPNFVLVGDGNSAKTSMGSIFGDILPIYPSYQELTSTIVTSFDSFISLILLSKTFSICLLSFLNTVLSNSIYQTFVLASSVYEQVREIPSIYSATYKKVLDLTDLFASQQGRELWWLEVKLDIKNLVNKAHSIISLILEVTKKFYLAFVIFLAIGFLNYATIYNSLSASSSSFLSRFIQNYSLNAAYTPVNNSYSYANSTSSIPVYSSTNISPIQIITEYEVSEDENLQQISNEFGIKTETIKLNNPTIQTDVNAGQKIYIPWTDGYLLNSPKKITPEDLETLYGVKKDLLVAQNFAAYNSTENSFPQDSIILIPTDDLNKIENGNKMLESQKKMAKEAEKQTGSTTKQAEPQKQTEAEAEQKKTQNLSNISTQSSKKIIKEQKSVAVEASKEGFIWPTTGAISRCFSSGHRGCDITNSSEPDIIAAKSGVIKTVGYEAGGYGNFVVINHGNNLYTLYAHMQKVYVSEGAVVSQGKAIGQMGCVGRCTGTHLHFEVRSGSDSKSNSVNPLPYLKG